MNVEHIIESSIGYVLVKEMRFDEVIIENLQHDDNKNAYMSLI